MHDAEEYLRRAEWDAWWARHRGWVELVAPDLFGARPAGHDGQRPGATGPAVPGAAPAAAAEPDFEGLFALIEAALDPGRPGR